MSFGSASTAFGHFLKGVGELHRQIASLPQALKRNPFINDSVARVELVPFPTSSRTTQSQ